MFKKIFSCFFVKRKQSWPAGSVLKLKESLAVPELQWSSIYVPVIDALYADLQLLKLENRFLSLINQTSLLIVNAKGSLIADRERTPVFLFALTCAYWSMTVGSCLNGLKLSTIKGSSRAVTRPAVFGDRPAGNVQISRASVIHNQRGRVVQYFFAIIGISGNKWLYDNEQVLADIVVSLSTAGKSGRYSSLFNVVPLHSLDVDTSVETESTINNNTMPVNNEPEVHNAPVVHVGVAPNDFESLSAQFPTDDVDTIGDIQLTDSEGPPDWVTDGYQTVDEPLSDSPNLNDVSLEQAPSVVASVDVNRNLRPDYAKSLYDFVVNSVQIGDYLDEDGSPFVFLFSTFVLVNLTMASKTFAQKNSTDSGADVATITDIVFAAATDSAFFKPGPRPKSIKGRCMIISLNSNADLPMVQ